MKLFKALPETTAKLSQGTFKDDVLNGTSASDRLIGLRGNDSLFGGVGDDLLFGGTGNDALFGGEGNDRLEGSIGDDILDGGPGVNAAIFGGGHAVAVSLVNGTATGLGNDRLVRIYDVETGKGSDQITGDSQPNVIRSGGGNDIIVASIGPDIIYGGPGRDTYVLQAQFGGVEVDLSQSGPQSVSGYGQVSLIGIENITLQSNTTSTAVHKVLGNDLDNTLRVEHLESQRTPNVIFVGGGGNDTLIGAVANEGGPGDDVIKGSADLLTLARYQSSADIRVDLSIRTRQATGEGNDKLADVENLSTGNGNDRLSGNWKTNLLSSSRGDDTLIGRGGVDFLIAGKGDDVLDGGKGNDSMVGDIGADTYVFRKGDGRDSIDFQDGVDVIHLLSGVRSFSGVTVERISGETFIQFANVKIAVLNLDILPEMIGAEDFMFG